jgi:uncharacterized protein YndB with AHSA1/START domain
MLWIVLYIVGGLVGLIVLMAIIGLVLPRDHVASRRVVLACPPDAVWRALVDRDAQPSWRRGLKRVERVDDRRFREVSTQGTILFEIVEDRPNERRVVRIADDKLPFGGTWTYELSPADDGGTALTITEDGFIKNTVFRFLSRTVFSTASTIEKFLADLAKHLGA